MSISCQIGINQNLVYNGSFNYIDYEYVKSFSYDPMELDSLPAARWYILDNSSPDFHMITNPELPFQDSLVRKFHSHLYDNKYALFDSTWVGFFPLTWAGAIETITGTLIKPMIKDSLYQVSFYLRCPNYSRYCLSKIGVKFGHKLPKFSIAQFPSYEELFQTPIYADVDFNICETCKNDKWQNYSGLYLASGGEQTITIGYYSPINYDPMAFFNDYRLYSYQNERLRKKMYKKHSDFILIQTNENYIDTLSTTYTKKHPYYLIDEISVVPL